jgi:hypothetical protein
VERDGREQERKGKRRDEELMKKKWGNVCVRLAPGQ